MRSMAGRPTSGSTPRLRTLPQLTNTGIGEDTAISLVLSRPSHGGLGFNAGYTWMDSNNGFDGSSSRAISNFAVPSDARRHLRGRGVDLELGERAPLVHQRVLRLPDRPGHALARAVLECRVRSAILDPHGRRPQHRPVHHQRPALRPDRPGSGDPPGLHLGPVPVLPRQPGHQRHRPHRRPQRGGGSLDPASRLPLWARGVRSGGCGPSSRWTSSTCSTCSTRRMVSSRRCRSVRPLRSSPASTRRRGKTVYRQNFTNAITNVGSPYPTFDVLSRWQARLGLRLSF